jgi:peptidoglycan/xylan/chitin deacetylase (PgdA/CDA1 family)
VEPNAESSGQERDAGPRPVGAAWPRRAALRAAAGLGIALPLSSAGCGASAARPATSDALAGTPTSAAPDADADSAQGAETAQASETATATAAATGTPTAAATTTTASGAAIEVAHAANAAGLVALTFHGDGPPAMAEQLLAEAERVGAQLTVMAVGRWLDAYPAMARRVLDGGHELGNHTERHIDIGALSPSAAYAEIENCAARLRKLTGSQGRWFRPSKAQHATPMVRLAAARAGYLDVLSYDLDPRDYADPGSAAVTRNVLGAIAPGDVVSLHLGHRGTIEALPAILDGLRTRGLRAVTADTLFPAARLPADGARAGTDSGSGAGIGGASGAGFPGGGTAAADPSRPVTSSQEAGLH